MSSTPTQSRAQFLMSLIPTKVSNHITWVMWHDVMNHYVMGYNKSKYSIKCTAIIKSQWVSVSHFPWVIHNWWIIIFTLLALASSSAQFLFNHDFVVIYQNYSFRNSLGEAANFIKHTGNFKRSDWLSERIVIFSVDENYLGCIQWIISLTFKWNHPQQRQSKQRYDWWRLHTKGKFSL